MDPYRHSPARAEVGFDDDMVVLAVIFLAGLAAAASSLADAGSTTGAAIGLIMMVFATSSLIRQIWLGRRSRSTTA